MVCYIFIFDINTTGWTPKFLIHKSDANVTRNPKSVNCVKRGTVGFGKATGNFSDPPKIIFGI
jgi:hypothetical protein